MKIRSAVMARVLLVAVVVATTFGPASSAFAQTVTNLIPNASLETVGTGGVPSQWAKISWGTPAPTFSYPVAGRSGNGASITLSANSTGDARWQTSAPIAVTPGTTYAYSNWYKSNVASEVNVEFKASNGALTYGWVASAPSSNNAWQQVTGNIVVPTGVTSLTVYHLLDKAGSLVVDDFSLTTSGGGSPNQPTVTISASPTSINSGQSSAITWSSTNATACTASGGWSGTKAVSGSQSVSPTVTTTYTLACTGAGGTASQSATVTVNPTTPPGGFTEGMVSITFDDSWLSQYQNALPILETAGIKGTFYFTTQPIQEQWDGFMTTTQVKDVANKGHEIAGHTITHADLTALGRTAITREVRDSKTYLQNLTGKTVTSLAYPYGNYNSTVASVVQQVGYTSARGVDGESLNLKTTDKYGLKSLVPEVTTTTAEMKAAVDAAKANKQWLVLTFHEVDTSGGQYSNTPAQVQEIVNYIKAQGIKVVTVKEGRALMQ